MPPKLIIIAGANGSGKTTFAKPYTKEKDYPFLNADEIAKSLEEKGVQNAMIKAGRIFFKRLYQYLEDKESFVVETTLSGTYINKVSAKAKVAGYEVELIYLFLDNPEICVERVKLRVKKGGHHVPVEDIIRRYFRSKRNFWDNFRELADKQWLLYNGEEGFQPVAVGNLDNFSVTNNLLLEKFHSNLDI